MNESVMTCIEIIGVGEGGIESQLLDVVESCFRRDFNCPLYRYTCCNNDVLKLLIDWLHIVIVTIT